ncbi:MAG TPA: SEC-C metal-binding domain-containing protein [Candidatus Bilamarchaeaceae archaeon]|nr:SEC-C metal-binding domain-containing protein [Candidatus Bilamarchaeaceae archaeon]
MSQLQRWKETARAAISGKGGRQLTPEARKLQLAQIDRRVEAYDHVLREYAEGWKGTSIENKEKGVYKRVLDFFGPIEGLTLDIGCGVGTFLRELARPDMIGIDINPYCLSDSYETLRSMGFDPLLSDSLHFDFSLYRGTYLRPDLVTRVPSLDQPILIADDMRTLEHTLHLINLLGRKVDVVSVMFLGGHTIISSIERETTGPKETLPLVNGIILPILPRICNPGARVLFVFRAAEVGVQDSLPSDVERSLREVEKFPDTPESFSRWYGKVLELKRMDSFTLPETDGGTFSDPKVRAATQINTLKAYMFDAVLKETQITGKIGRNDPCHCGSNKKYKKCCGS